MQKNAFWTALQIQQKGAALRSLYRKTRFGQLYRYCKKGRRYVACAEKHVLEGVTDEARAAGNTAPVQKSTFWKALEMKPQGPGTPHLCTKARFGQLYRYSKKRRRYVACAEKHVLDSFTDTAKRGGAT